MKWINPEIKRPKDGQKIITESSVGLFWGIFNSIRDGVVYVESNKDDEIWWQDIYQWIPYPKEF
jgi:hypothetical protein